MSPRTIGNAIFFHDGKPGISQPPLPPPLLLPPQFITSPALRPPGFQVSFCKWRGRLGQLRRWKRKARNSRSVPPPSGNRQGASRRIADAPLHFDDHRAFCQTARSVFASGPPRPTLALPRPLYKKSHLLFGARPSTTLKQLL